MTWSAQWRTKGDQNDAVFVLDDEAIVREALPASQPVLSRFLTQMGDLKTWRGDSHLGGDIKDAETWGELVIARRSSGEVIEVEPELFWQGIYSWFRSRKVDYDTPGLTDLPPLDDAPYLPRSHPMDD